MKQENTQNVKKIKYVNIDKASFFFFQVSM